MGWELYLFSDHTYAYSLWSDLPPENLVDMGRWHLSDGVLLFAPDSAEGRKWPWWRDRRFLALRGGETTDLRLFGLDNTFRKFTTEVASKGRASAAETFTALSLRKSGRWSKSDELALRDRILRIPPMHEPYSSLAVPSNNGLHQTGARRCGPWPSSEGQSLKRAPAGEAECSTGRRGRE